MKTPKMAVLAASLALNCILAYWFVWRQPPLPLPPVSGMVVLRTPGGLLEVSTINSEERFESTVQHTVLGVPVGKTVALIRVPAVYRYHVPLAKEWSIRFTENTVVAIAPAVQPSLPVAIDTGRLEAFSSGLWSPITGQNVLASLQKSITFTLNKKAATADLLALQRESARLTVTEFVNKWVAEQRLWKSSERPAIFVFFEDEPLSKSAAPLIAYR